MFLSIKWNYGVKQRSKSVYCRRTLKNKLFLFGQGAFGVTFKDESILKKSNIYRVVKTFNETGSIKNIKNNIGGLYWIEKW